MTRESFEPIQFKVALYKTESAARAGSKADGVATMSREQGEIAPRCDNQVPYTFPERVTRAFQAVSGRAEEEDLNDTCHLAEKKVVARVDDDFKHKPSKSYNEDQKAAEIVHPYLTMGKDEYQETLTYNGALQAWLEYLTSFFRKIEDLKSLTFIGVYKDDQVVKITVTREQFEQSLSALQEEITAHAAVTFLKLGNAGQSDKAAAKEQSAFHKKTYAAALTLLPKDQVHISPKLK
jgi:hypothetical protein